MGPIVVGTGHVEHLREGRVGELHRIRVLAHVHGYLVVSAEGGLIVGAAAVDAARVVDGEGPVVVEAELVFARDDVRDHGEDVGLLVPGHRDFLVPAAESGADGAQTLDLNQIDLVELLVEHDDVDAGGNHDVVGGADRTGIEAGFVGVRLDLAAEVAFPLGIRAELELGVAAVRGRQVEDAFIVALDARREREGRGGSRIPALVAARGVEDLRESGHEGRDGHFRGSGLDAFGEGFAVSLDQELDRNFRGFRSAGGDDGVIEGVHRHGEAGLGKAFGQQVRRSVQRPRSEHGVRDGAQVHVVAHLLAVGQAGRLPGKEGHLGQRLVRIELQLVLFQDDDRRDGVAVRVDGHAHGVGHVLVSAGVQDGHLEGEDEGIILRQGRERGVEQLLEGRLGRLEAGGVDGGEHLGVIDIGRLEHVAQTLRKVPVGRPRDVHVLVHRVRGHQDVCMGQELGGDGIRREGIFRQDGAGSRAEDQCGNRQYVSKLFHNADCHKVTSLYRKSPSACGWRGGGRCKHRRPAPRCWRNRRPLRAQSRPGRRCWGSWRCRT